MITIALQNVNFFARHGFYPEEQILGNKFTVDISVSFMPGGDMHSDNIRDTVNYESLYAIAKREMQHPRKLLETVAQAIVDEIKHRYPQLNHIMVSIKKQNPMLGGSMASSNIIVTYNKPTDELQ